MMAKFADQYGVLSFLLVAASEAAGLIVMFAVFIHLNLVASVSIFQAVLLAIVSQEGLSEYCIVSDLSGVKYSSKSRLGQLPSKFMLSTIFAYP